MKVYQAINKVQAALAKTGIGKDSTNTIQNYKFRGIDAVYNALAPLLAANGLVILPRVRDRLVTERQTQKGGVLFYVTLTVEFDFVCSEDASKHTVVTVGEAMDSGDKATNKAMSAAYKYAAIQAFSIPTEGDNDADATTHEVMSDAEKRAILLQEALEAHGESVAYIKKNLALGKLALASEAWFELSDDAKRALWIAPTAIVNGKRIENKNAPFTTAEREIMRTPEFRTANGQAAAAGEAL